MSLSNIQIAGAIKRTQKGDADWYYGGDNEAWPDLATALSNIPAAVRPGKTIAVFTSGTIAEFWWPTNAVADADLIAKKPILSSATETVSGTIAVATDSETQNTSGTIIDTKAITPKKLFNWWTAIKAAAITFGGVLKLTAIADGSNTFFLMVAPDGTVIGDLTPHDPEVTDPDITGPVITLYNAGGFNAGNNFTASVTPNGGKTFLRGDYFYYGALKFEAGGDNSVGYYKKGG